jgi:hypothetical protein
MLYSQNGWPVADSTSTLVRTTAQGVIWFSANHDVAWFMDRYVNWYALRVEPLKLPYDVGGQWSYAVRNIRGSTTAISNHASATARDLNAAAHPRGVPLARTYTAEQVRDIRAYLGAIRTASGVKVFRWGGDYITAPVDGMHVEIMVNPHDLMMTRALIEMQEAQAKGTDMEWGEKVALTAGDAAAWNLTGPRIAATASTHATPWKAGDMVAISDMVRYPTLSRKIDAFVRTELPTLRSGLSVMGSAISALTTQVNQLATLLETLTVTPKGSDDHE